MCRLAYLKIDSDKVNVLAFGGEKTYVKPLGKMVMVHHTLPIQTLPDIPLQPARLNEGWHMMFVGEFFDYPPAYKSDTEWLIATFKPNQIEKWMAGLVARDGFFAILIANKNGDTYFVTDYLGKKELFFNTAGEIASQPSSLTNQIFVPGVALAARRGYPVERTIFYGVGKAIPGVVYSNYKPIVQGTIPNIKMRFKDLPGQVREIMFKSVKARLGHSNRPVGVFVSGGLDSSIIAHHCPEANFYSIDNKEDNDYVKLLPHAVTKLKYGWPEMDDILWANEGPWDLGSMVPQYLLFKAAKETVIITGDGADELFGGYDRSQYYDSIQGDLEELSYYHLPRIDRMAAAFTKECRNPFLSAEMISFVRQLPLGERRGKKLLKEAYKDLLPKEIIERKKVPLRNTDYSTDPKFYKLNLIKKYLELWTQSGSLEQGM